MPSPLPGLSLLRPVQAEAGKLEHVLRQRPLQRVLAFAGRNIDDVVNSRVAKNEVLAYFKMGRWIERQIEVGDLERQWNPLGRRQL